MDWTEEDNAKLMAAWNDGLAASAIGRDLGCSKSAVIGRAHRIDLPRRRQANHRKFPVCLLPAPPEPQPAPKPHFAGPYHLSAPPPPAPSVEPNARPVPRALAPVFRAPVHLPEPLCARPCSWPIGTPRTATFRYCDAPVDGIGRSYCADHAKVAYQRRAVGR